MKEMTIGVLARAAGVNLETIRYYQRRGLIGTPRKPPGGVRRYDANALAHLGFIKRAQQLGFNLRDIRELLEPGVPAPAPRHACWRKPGARISKRACTIRSPCGARWRV